MIEIRDAAPEHHAAYVRLHAELGVDDPVPGPTRFVGCAIGKVTIEQASKELWAFYGAMCLALLLVTYIPALSVWLPGLMK
jgi:TRAP-type C4-dicarboxylate transport system permease large subunit